MGDEIMGTNGLKSALEQAHDREKSPPGSMDGDQMALLPLRNAEESAEIAQRMASSRRGRGRPVGAKNKNTQAWSNYILKKFPSPLEGLASVAFRPLNDLARELKGYAGASDLSKPTYDQAVELLKIQLGAAQALLPYLHQRQPMVIEAGENGLVNLFIGDLKAGDVKVSESTDLTLDIIDPEIVENQGFTDNENKNSDASSSDVTNQDIENKHKNKERETD